MKRFCLIALLPFLPLTAQAEMMTCPIGGERFEATEPQECTPDPRLTMIFAPASICYGTHVLQQCPQNFLPLYKGFTSDDLALLETFMASETYDSSVDHSAYYLAYAIEKFIGESDSTLPVELLFDGLVRDSARSFSDEVYLEDFLFEMQSILRQSPENSQPVMQAVTSFVMLKAGLREDAIAMLEQARQHDIAGLNTPEFLSYLAAIESCLADESSPYCDPRAIFPIN